MCDIESEREIAYNEDAKKAAPQPARPLSEDFMEKYFIVVPCYNEEEVLPETMKRLGEKLVSLQERGLASEDSRILFVDDGSADRTWEMIKQAHEAYPIFTGLSLDQNRGHQTALTEGLMAARAERAVSVSIDADLQDDVDAIDAMAEKHAAGAHIVCGVRASRQTDTFMKRFTARAYYRLMRLSLIHISLT